MKAQIDTALTAIETTEEVAIVYACKVRESRLGFASADSDYDVRFFYLHPPSWYLAVNLESKRDVIERPIDDSLDLSGWDIRKALGLLRKSNPPLIEWLGSPIVYRERRDAVARLREVAGACYSPIACGYHYLRMAEGTVRQHLRGEMVQHKKYFYALRPLLAVCWIEQGKGIVPTEFQRLVEGILPPGELRDAIETLTAAKASGAELDRGPRIDVIGDYIDSELLRLSSTRFDRSPPTPPVETLDRFFQDLLSEVYGTA